MNFEKAYKEMMNGKKIRRKEWEPFMHLQYKDKKVKTYKGEYTDFYNNANVLISEGWKIVDGDGKEFSFVQALEELKNKKKLTNDRWVEETNKNFFIFIDVGQIVICKSVEFDFMPSYKCLCADDWEIMR